MAVSLAQISLSMPEPPRRVPEGLAASGLTGPLRAASSRLLLTGTPLANNVPEFMRLANLASPG
eukprot:2296-Prymnesium_polylepis.1